MAIQNLPTVASANLGSADAVVLFSNFLGCDASTTLANLVAWLQGQLTGTGSTITQYFAPNATGWSLLVAPPVNGENVFLLVTPVAGYAAGTITLPVQSTCIDGQSVIVSCTQAVTTLTVAGNGATAVNGAPTTLAANAFFRLRYDGPSKSWFRNG